MGKYTVLSVFGTRPEAIKMAPLVLELAKHDEIESKVAVTAQHREMLDQVLSCFGIEPDYDLNIMKQGQTLADITTQALRGLMGVIDNCKPDLVLVHGDTTTTFAGALAAFYSKVPCCHVEAGLRTFDKYAPFPEEMNRSLTGVLADLHFAPTVNNKNNLLACGIAENKIFITGNTVIDALLEVVKKPCDLELFGLKDVNWQKQVILMTCHRRENWGEPMQQIFSAVRRLAEERADLQIVYPVHKNPLVREPAERILGDLPNVFLIEPLEYVPMCHVIDKCRLVVTDSGGLQEEAPALGKPVLVLRDVTERQEAVDAGTALLLGTDESAVYNGIAELLDNDEVYQKMAHAANPYGSGDASVQITEHINAWLRRGEY